MAFHLWERGDDTTVGVQFSLFARTRLFRAMEA
jgi:hypothetical protein